MAQAAEQKKAMVVADIDRDLPPRRWTLTASTRC